MDWRALTLKLLPISIDSSGGSGNVGVAGEGAVSGGEERRERGGGDVTCLSAESLLLLNNFMRTHSLPN